ncbi:hypothetical protein Ari01nite_95600 [Paractinoplanes rishiriensis]|uniref:Uncharacterized protein n=1 Tax=Paractinoplanes rishiriensis TaxID=1050105 RepID=A0A919N1Q8_9ACTN|nr:hypothetical protein Ari01nite_95600 [Actinoplanes rishiriensis]
MAARTDAGAARRSRTNGPLADFERIAAGYPVFRITSRATGTHDR